MQCRALLSSSSDSDRTSLIRHIIHQGHMREGEISGEVSAAPGRAIEQTAIMALSTGAKAGKRAQTRPSIEEKEGL